MSEEAKKIKESITEVCTLRRDILTGASQGRYGYKPAAVMQDAAATAAAAKVLVNKMLNEEEIRRTDQMDLYNEANGLCMFTRDSLEATEGRLAGIVGYLNELETDVKWDRLGLTVPMAAEEE